MGDPTRHALLPPSGAAVWVPCPGSVTMSAHVGLPAAEEGEAAEEGTAAHEVAMRWALGDSTTSGDDDMDDAAELWARTLEGDGWKLEAPLAVPSVSPHVWGTPDGRRYLRDAGLLQVADFKYGFLTVEPTDWQLILYAIGALDEAGINGHEDQYTRVELIIVQPRAPHSDGPVRRVTMMASELRGYVNRAAMAAEKALSPDAHVRAGEQCRYCPARYACPAARQAAGDAREYVQAARPDHLDAEAVGYEIAALRQAQKAIEYRLTGLEAQAVETIKQGGDVPGWAIEPGQGRRQWTCDVEAVRRLGEYLGLSLTQEEPITPTQAIKAGVDKGVILSYSEVPKRAHKLVPSKQTRAAKAFSK